MIGHHEDRGAVVEALGAQCGKQPRDLGYGALVLLQRGLARPSSPDDGLALAVHARRRMRAEQVQEAHGRPRRLLAHAAGHELEYFDPAQDAIREEQVGEQPQAFGVDRGLEHVGRHAEERHVDEEERLLHEGAVAALEERVLVVAGRALRAIVEYRIHEHRVVAVGRELGHERAAHDVLLIQLAQALALAVARARVDGRHREICRGRCSHGIGEVREALERATERRIALQDRWEVNPTETYLER